MTGSDPDVEVGTSQHAGVQLLSSPDQRWGHSGEEGSTELREMGEWQQQVIGASRKWGEQGRAGHGGRPGLQWVGCPRRLCHAMVRRGPGSLAPGVTVGPPAFPWASQAGVSDSTQLLNLLRGMRNKACHVGGPGMTRRGTEQRVHTANI